MAFFDRFRGGKKIETKKSRAVPAKKESRSASAKPVVVKHEPPADTFAHRVLVHPVVSEKTARLEKQGQYVFVVRPHANKVEIKKAVEHHYKVHVTAVNVVNQGGKSVRSGRTLGKQKDTRKAYVTLKIGETLVY